MSDPTGDDGGDAVCWLDRLCPECAAMPSGADEHCWRCGAKREEASPGDGLASPPWPSP